MRDGYRVIDVDTHVTPSVEVLLRYADAALRDRAAELQPYVRTLTSPPGRGHPEGEYSILRLAPLAFQRVAGHKEGAQVATTGAGARGALEGRVENLAKGQAAVGVQHDNPNGRLADMDAEGVDIDFIIPGTWAPGASCLDLGLARGLFDAYHRYMADYCAADVRRLKGLLLVPGADPAHAARTIRAHAAAPWAAAVWPILPEGLPVDDPDLLPIWAAMAECDLPLVHHSFFYEPPYFPGYRDIWGNAIVARAAAHPWGAQRTLAYLLISGLFDRFPNLRVGFVETGHGWLAHWVLRLDSQVSYVKGAAPPLKHSPLEYVQRGHVYCGIENHEGPRMTRAIVDVLGDAVLMYQSDYPHPESLFPHTVDTVLGWRDILGEPATRKLMGENAARFLRLGPTPWD